MRQEEIDASNRRWRLIFGALALVVPVLLGGVLQRQSGRLDALAARGVEGVGVVVERRRESDLVFYEYDAEGVRHRSNVRGEELVGEVGSSFALTYLPGDAGLSRPFYPYSDSARAAEKKPAVALGVPLGAFVFLGGAAGLCHRALRRSALGAGPGKPWLTMAHLPMLLAVIFYGTLLYSASFPDSQAVFRALWGEKPLGLPLRWVVMLGLTVLYAPAFFVLPHLVPLVPVGSGSLGALVSILRAPAERRRSRNIALAGIVYFLAVGLAWIAYAAHRGV
jgi:hypothetical protein